MGWGEVLKRLLDAFAQLVRDIPVWAKSVLAFGIFAVLAVGVIANLDQLIVYDIEILEAPRVGVGPPYRVEHKNTGRESQTDENGRIKLVLPIGLFGKQENDIVVKKPVVNIGEDAPRIRYGFTSRAWQSRMLSLTLTCDFRGRACALEKTGQFESIEEGPKGQPEAPRARARGVAYAQERVPAGLPVPTLQTLQRVVPEGGYTEVRLTEVQLAPDYCKRTGACPDRLFAEVRWNGIRLLFDGVEPEALRGYDLAVTEDGQVRGELAFGAENTLIGAEAAALTLTLYSRGGDRGAYRQTQQAPAVRPGQRPVEVFQARVDVLRLARTPLKGQNGVVSATLVTRTVLDRSGRSYEVFVGAGRYEQVVEMRDFVGGKLGLALDGQEVVGVIRPPLADKEAWALALGVRDPATGRVRILFAEPEARRLLADLKQVPPARRGPLQGGSFLLYKLRDVR